MKELTLSRIQHYGGLLLARPLFGFRVRGAEKVPRRGGLIIVCNHISEMDPPILGFAVPRTVSFMAKIELFRNRFGRFLMEELKAFPVDRSIADTGALRRAIEILKEGFTVVIFPEGTRSRDGRMLPGKPGISLIASASGAPVVPAFIWGTDHPLRAFLRRGAPFSVDFGDPIPSGKLSDIRKAEGAKAVADEIMRSIERIGVNAGLYGPELNRDSVLQGTEHEERTPID